MFQRKEKLLTKCEATKIYITERVMCQKVNFIKIYLYMIMKYKKNFLEHIYLTWSLNTKKYFGNIFINS